MLPRLECLEHAETPLGGWMQVISAPRNSTSKRDYSTSPSSPQSDSIERDKRIRDRDRSLPLAECLRTKSRADAGLVLRSQFANGSPVLAAVHNQIRCMKSNSVDLQQGYTTGALGRVVELHAAYYQKHWGFGRDFETKVAIELAEFLNRFDENRDGFWTAQLDGRVEGSITIDGIHADNDGAHLRWFIVSEAVRGEGIGNKLVNSAVAYCRDRGFRRVYLWTFEGLESARHLYEKAGFTLTKQQRGTQWGAEVNEQRFDLSLA